MSDIVERLRAVAAEGYDFAGEAAAEIERLVRERDALLPDAERYRWLRHNINPVHFCQYMNYHPSEQVMWETPESIDAAIDAARSGK